MAGQSRGVPLKPLLLLTSLPYRYSVVHEDKTIIFLISFDVFCSYVLLLLNVNHFGEALAE